MNRRRFLETTTGLLGASAMGGVLVGGTGCGRPAGDDEPPAGTATTAWQYSICNEIMQGWEWDRQCAYAVETGFRGLEVAPFTLADHVDQVSKERRAEMRGIAEDAGVDIIGLHWLFVTPEGLHTTTPDEAVRRRSWDYLVKLAELSADLGGEVMIFGSPAQRSSQGISPEEAVANLTEGLRSVAPAIGDLGVKVLIEPLSRDQTDVINTVAEAVAVVQDVDHPAVSSMFDFHNTADETQPLDEIVRTYHPYIEHVHIQEMDGSYLGVGTGAQDFLPALRAFRDVGYDKWVSLEVFDFEPGPERIATASMETLQEMVSVL